MPSSPRTLVARFALAALFFAVSLRAGGAEPSLAPAFGPEGAEFTSKAQKGHVVQGWLPKGWDDNTEWAPITATYSKLDDSPDPAVTALRINLEQMEDGQLQLTTYSGERTYEHGKPYRITGWLRSPNQTALTVGLRQVGDPYEWYFEQDLPTESSWKPFTFDFTPQKDFKAVVMLAVKTVGIVDLAGVVVTDKITADAPPPPKPATAGTAAGKDLLPPFGAEGEEVNVKAKDNHVVHGWLPTGWNDNTEWARIDATYSKTDDSPAKGISTLRIKVEKMDDGQLQLTSYAAERIYDHGRIYRVSGWLRSPDRVAMSVGARQSEDPYEMYYEKELSTDTAWKQFEFEFAPKKDIKAIIMFAVKGVGTVDLAGVKMTDEGPAE